MARRLPVNGTFVEIGVWAGRSLIFFLSCLQDIGKEAKVFAVDTWKGSVAEPHHQEIIANKFEGDLYKHFLWNLKNAGFEDKVVALKMESVKAAECFADNSVDICFIDASHTYDEVIKDINAWNPKVTTVISGHDIEHVPVRKAVSELVPGYKIAGGQVWHYDKNDKNDKARKEDNEIHRV